MDLLELQAQRHIILMAMLGSWITRYDRAHKASEHIRPGVLLGSTVGHRPSVSWLYDFFDIDAKMAKRYPHFVGLHHRAIKYIYAAMCEEDNPTSSIAQGRIMMKKMKSYSEDEWT